MGLEQRVNYILNRHPKFKKIIKRIYQRFFYTFSKKIKFEGNVERLSPNDKKEYFFGYYDKSPWDSTGRYVLCMRANNTWSDVSPKEPLEIILIDTQNNNSWKKIAESKTWNIQMGCMAQWLGPKYDKEIIFNDYRDEDYCSVILNVFTGEEKIIKAPIYSVSADGQFALTLDFSRLYNLRPGYGYYNKKELTKGIALPNATAIWYVDLVSRQVKPLLSYNDFASFEPREEMMGENVVHKVNHIMISPNGKRFMVLYRWFVGERKYTRLITCDINGENMFLLNDDDMVSHCFWKNDAEIIAFENKKDGGPGYYLMRDQTNEYKHLWQKYSNDGHPSYAPSGELVVVDSYPSRKRIQDIKILRDSAKDGIVVARVFAPFKYDNDTRCDLHPRWNRKGDVICFDSVFEGHRGLYTINIGGEKNKKYKIVYLMTSAKKSGPIQQMLNIIKELDRKKFEPILVTMYDEDKNFSQLNKYLPYVAHYKAPTGKMNVIMGRTKNLKKVLGAIQPDVIHSLGVFPDYAVSRMKKYSHIITLRNYVWVDYPTKFGRLKGIVLAKMHIYAMKHTTKTITCSESLSKIYEEKLHLSYDFIRNGVDIVQYSKANKEEVPSIRKELGLPKKAFIFVYSGQMIDRKNQRFLLESFCEAFKSDTTYLLLLGDGPDYQALYNDFGKIKNIDFRGNVDNVNYYLQACDAYVSTSKSEGMPNGVLEAMATGLPVILSNIEQHNEVIETNPKIGFTYRQEDKFDLVNQMNKMMKGDYLIMGEAAYQSAHENFSASVMSKKYQELYELLAQ